MSEIKPFQVERPWGNFRQFNLNSLVTVKIVTIKKNEELSLQSHAKRAEFWKVMEARVWFSFWISTLSLASKAW